MSMDIVSRLRCVLKGDKTAQAGADEIERLRAEIERLNSCLRYEQHRAERVGTHGPGCETWGPAHYSCAVQAIEKLQHSLADRDEDLEKNLGTVVHLSGQLAASREREARMRKLVGFLLIVARTAGDAMPETHARIVSEAEAALAEGAQG